MDSFSIKDMERNVKSLMSPVDEETWRQGGYLTKWTN
jgi:hypothetical protein